MDFEAIVGSGWVLHQNNFGASTGTHARIASNCYQNNFEVAIGLQKHLTGAQIVRLLHTGRLKPALNQTLGRHYKTVSTQPLSHKHLMDISGTSG
jgi:hypothetical protein